METINITKDDFENGLFNPTLVVVQKEHSGLGYHLTVLHVYDKVGQDGKIVESYFREITNCGTEYWKEV